MAQARQRAGLTSKAFGESGVSGQMRRQELDGYGAVQVQLNPPVNNAHAAAAEFRFYAELW